MNLPLTIKIISIIFFIYFLVVFYVYSKQRSLLYVPNIDNYDDETLTINTDEVFIRNSDGNDLRSLFYKNPSNKINKLAKYNQNILLISWRSYSGNQGTPSEQGLYDDAQSAINWLNDKDILTEHIIIYGESLGTAVSLEVAQDKPFKGIILEAPFTSMIDAAKFHYPYLPVSLMLKDKYLSSEKIKNVKSPIFIMHAKGDDIVPFSMGEKMFELANEPKQSYFIDENEHLVTYDDQLMKSMDNFYKILNINE